MRPSASAASTSTNFAKLLASSKVVSQYDPAIPSLVYTSQGGSFKRSDFGLKRALPRMRSPAIKVASLDSPTMRLTDFEYGSRELQFVKRWREAGTSISGGDPSALYSGPVDELYGETLAKVAEAPGACTWDRDSFESVQELKEYAKTGKKKAQRLAEAAREQKDLVRKAQLREALTAKDILARREQSAAPGLEPDKQNVAQAELQQGGSSIEAESIRTDASTSKETLLPSPLSDPVRTHDSTTLKAEAGSEASAVGIRSKKQEPMETDVAFSPNYLEMDEKEFKRLLVRVRQLRPQYREYIRAKAHARASSGDSAEFSRKQASRIDTFDVFHNTTESSRVQLKTGADIDEFLNHNLGVSSENKPSLDELHPCPHHSLGLSYQPPNLYQADVTNRTVPLRVLQQPSAASKTGALSGVRHYPVSVLGTVNEAKQNDLAGQPNAAHYLPDTEGHLNVDYGKLEARVEVAFLKDEYIRARAGQQEDYSPGERANSFLAGRAPSSGASPTAQSILDDGPISVRTYVSRTVETSTDGQATLTFRSRDGHQPENRIGGMNWIRNDPEAAIEAARNRPVGDMTTRELFGVSSRITPPNPDEHVRPNGYPGAKAAANSKKDNTSLTQLLGKFETLDRSWLRA